MAMFRSWRSQRFAIKALEDRVQKLERSELERELTVFEQVEKLKDTLKRLQARENRAGAREKGTTSLQSRLALDEEIRATRRNRGATGE